MVGVFAWGFPNPAPGMFDEPMFAALEKVQGGDRSAGGDSVVAGGSAATDIRAF